MVFRKSDALNYTYNELQQLTEDIYIAGGGSNSVEDVQDWVARWLPALEEMPLYINSEMLHERVTARWRLRLGRFKLLSIIL
jgi:hypothetical protein